MAEKGPKTLEYGEELSIGEVDKRLAEIRGIVDQVRIKYALPATDLPGLITKDSAQRIDPEDNEILSKCIGVLLPMGMLGVVQDEARGRRREEMEGTILARISELQTEILVYVSGFEDSGVELMSVGFDPEGSHNKLKSNGSIGKFFRRLSGKGS